MSEGIGNTAVRAAQLWWMWAKNWHKRYYITSWECAVYVQTHNGRNSGTWLCNYLQCSNINYILWGVYVVDYLSNHGHL